jgi:hypothetical protein
MSHFQEGGVSEHARHFSPSSHFARRPVTFRAVQSDESDLRKWNGWNDHTWDDEVGLSFLLLPASTFQRLLRGWRFRLFCFPKKFGRSVIILRPAGRHFLGCSLFLHSSAGFLVETHPRPSSQTAATWR